MPCKYFRNWLAISFCLATSLVAQPLDWHTDVVCFGTDQHEWSPQLVSLPGGALRAFCLREQSHLSARMTTNRGEVWDGFFDTNATGDSTRMIAESDMEYSYLLSWRRGGHEITLHRMSLFTSEWPVSPLVLDLPDSLSLMAVDLTTDFAIWPEDNFLYLAYLANSNSGGVVGFARSESQGEDWIFETEVAWNTPVTDSASVLSLIVSWTDEWTQFLTLAMERDRPGSIGEEIVLYRSEDYGQSWDGGRTIDSSAYTQQHPSLTARGDTLLCAYARRNGASVAREIFYTFTLEASGEWAAPEALTSQILDDHHPQLQNSVGSGAFLLSYARSAPSNSMGTLYSRSAPLAEPWAWQEETLVSEVLALRVNEGWDVCSHADGFAAVWTSRLVGDDGDVMYDASWRSMSAGPRPSDVSEGIHVYPNPTQGVLNIESGNAEGELLLYDLLGRRVTAYNLSGRKSITLPEHLPQGPYYLRTRGKRDVHRVLLIR